MILDFLTPEGIQLLFPINDQMSMPILKIDIDHELDGAKTRDMILCILFLFIAIFIWLNRDFLPYWRTEGFEMVKNGIIGWFNNLLAYIFMWLRRAIDWAFESLLK